MQRTYARIVGGLRAISVRDTGEIFLFRFKLALYRDSMLIVVPSHGARETKETSVFDFLYKSVHLQLEEF